jgi:hypothetical protein
MVANKILSDPTIRDLISDDGVRNGFQNIGFFQPFDTVERLLGFY